MKHSSATSHLPPLDALQAVLAAHRAGSFSGAADEFDITHSAVSRRIAMVEQWAGVRVFERHGRGVRLTIEGQHLVRLIEQALDTLASGSTAWRQVPQPDAVRISVLPSFARLCLLPNLAPLEGSPQDLRVELELDHRFAQLTDIDVAIRYGRGAWHDGIAIPLFEENLVPVASPGVARTLGDSPSAIELLRHPLIHDAYPDAWRLWLGDQGCSYRPRPQDRRYPDYDLGLFAAAAGCGIAMLRDPYGAAFVDNGSLIRLSSHAVASPLRFHATLSAGPKRRAVRSFLERLSVLAKAGDLAGSATAKA